MSPLNLEIVDPETKEWRAFGTLNPGDIPGSISHYTENGSREVYVFECESDGKISTVKKSISGVDIENDVTRRIYSEGFVEIATLNNGESFVLPIRNQAGREVPVRFTHVERE